MGLTPNILFRHDFFSDSNRPKRSGWYLFFLFILIPSLFFGCNQANEPPVAKKGVLDLRNLSFNNENSINLSGEWEFYPGVFLDPQQQIDPAEVNNRVFLNVPDSWNGKTVNGKPLSRFGFGTYRLKIKLPDQSDSGEPFAIRTAWCGSSFTLFADGKEIAAAGKPGTDKNSTKACARTGISPFYPKSEETVIVVHVANFNHRKGGFNDSFKIGKLRNINTLEKWALAKEFFIAGCLFCIGFFYLGQILINRKLKSQIYFGIFCLLMSLRMFTNGNIYIATFFPGLSWEAILKIDYLTLTFAPVFAVLYFISLFPHKHSKTLGKIFLSISVAHGLYVILAPTEVFSLTLIGYEIFIMLLVFYAVVIFARAISGLEPYALMLLPGLIALIAGAVNDILFNLQIVHTGYLSEWGLLVFTLCLSFVIARRSAVMQRTIENQANLLRETNEQATISRLGTILGLAKLAEYRDPDTGAHLERLQEYSQILLKELKKNKKYDHYISQRYIKDIYDSIILHDIGKVGVPDKILLKEGKLTEEEFNIIKKHSVIGGDTICNIEARVRMQSFLSLAREIAYSHHEKWDGSGYPYGLSGEEIPLSARICAVVDVYDALTSKRSYKEPFSHQKACSIILEGKEAHFDPDLVEAFSRCTDQFNAIREELHGKDSSYPA